MRKDKDILIYIVDDDSIYSTFIWSYFESNGFKNIKIFEDAQSCLDQLFRMPDLIILDFQMEGMNGLQALKGIKSFDPDLAVILLSGKGNVQVAVDSLKYGGLDYIVKDDEALVHLGKLIEKIKKIRLIHSNKKRKRIRKQVFIALIIPILLTLIILYL